MALKEHCDPRGPNDAFASEHGPNDYNNNLAAAKAASVAAQKAEREAADRAASEFKAKAAKDADHLAACRAEIIALKAQLQEAQQLVNISETKSNQTISMTEALEHDLTTKSNELAAAVSESENLKSNISSLNNMISEYSAVNRELRSEISQIEISISNMRSDYWKLMHEIDNEGLTVRQIRWGNRNLEIDGNIAWKVKERVRNGWAIPFSNDFFGCNPEPGSRKYGIMKFCRTQKVKG